MRVLILGNGRSRLQHDELIRSWPGEVWGCNRVYQDYGPILARITTDSIDCLHEILRYRAESGAHYKIWAWGKVAAAGADEKFTSPGSLRSNSGTMLAMQALEEGHEVALCGVDLGGPDCYIPGLEHVDKSVWVRQWQRAIEHYGAERISFIGVDRMPVLTGPKGEKKLTEVVFGNGYKTLLNDEIAKRMIKKGECERVEKPKPAEKKEYKKSDKDE